VLAADLTRIGKLVSQEAQDAAEARSVRADAYDPDTNTFDDFGAAAKAANSTPIFGLTRPPSLGGIASSYNMALGAGEGHVVGGTVPDDESEYQLCRWDEQTITWPAGGNPDPSNAKLCTIYATAADVPSELQSRNILTDPVTRATSPQNVYKLSSPVAVISVAAGSAASPAAQPSIPAGSLPLFDVLVPAGAADSTEFVVTRRSWRRIEFPGTAMHGVIDGCETHLSGPLVPLGASTAYLPAGAHRLVIDGEFLQFKVATWGDVLGDVSHSVGAAPANNDLPSYLYLCGGRNSPVAVTNLAGAMLPVALVNSTTPPDAYGYPTADLAISSSSHSPAVAFPRRACCYVGIRFFAAGSSVNLNCYYDGDWIRSATRAGAPIDMYGVDRFSATTGFKEPAQTGEKASWTQVTLGSLPGISQVMDLTAIYSDTDPTKELMLQSSSSATWDNLLADLVATDATNSGWRQLRLPRDHAISLYIKGLSSTGNLYLVPTGYKMHVPRLKT